MRNRLNRETALTMLCLLMLVFAPGNANAMRTLDPFGTIVAAKFARTELCFGRDRVDVGEVSEEEFSKFVDEFVTPRFPRGLTVIDANGQWLASGTRVIKERSKVLIIIYPRNERRAAGQKIEEIRTEYKKRFAQDSVVRIDMSKSLDISFE